MDRKKLEKQFFEEDYGTSNGLIRKEHSTLKTDNFFLRLEHNKLLGVGHPDIDSLKLNALEINKSLVPMGQSSLGIVISKQWLKERNLEKGDKVRGLLWR